MNVLLPLEGVCRDQPLADTGRLAPCSPREIWAEHRRLMEREDLSVGPAGPRSRLGGASFHFGVVGFGRIARHLGIHRFGRRNALAVRLNAMTLTYPDLPPAFDGYRVLHLSDTHLDYLPELAAVARGMLAGLEVDLLALTGDIHGDRRALLVESVSPLVETLRDLKIRDRSIAVLGNHDPAAMAEQLERVGFDVLVNESTVIERGGETLVVTGLDDVHRFYTAAAGRALTDAPAGFRLALVHSAEIADHAAAAGYKLYLCGHTHGGQICLPGGRPIFTRLYRCQFGARGQWRCGDMIGYTSNGLGISGPPWRFNCRGEMTVITLRGQTPKE
jgi:predicted MPP superfamily phosphohydrolase